jgi:putative Holliday junction resolvase
MARFLAFDFGKRRIGVAVGQRITSTAEGIETVVNTDQGPDWKAIDRLIKGWKPKAIIVGLPLHMDGSPSDMSADAICFAKAIETRYAPTPVHTIDERLSTLEAREQLKEYKSPQYAYKKVDAYAAKIILETWFSTQPLPVKPSLPEEGSEGKSEEDVS